MLKEAIEKIVSLAGNQTYAIGGENYSDRKLVRIEPHVDRPECLGVGSLDSAAQLIAAEIGHACAHTPLFVQVKSPTKVAVYTTLDSVCARNVLYAASSDVPAFCEGWRDHETAVIELRSRFVDNEDTQYLLSLLGRIVKEDSVSSEDNGVSQQVTARTGVALSSRVSVRPRVRLRPYRTFLEVEQPESEFLLRLDGDGRVGLFEADGGMWKLDAKKNIAQYLKNALASLGDKVIVME